MATLRQNLDRLAATLLLLRVILLVLWVLRQLPGLRRTRSCVSAEGMPAGLLLVHICVRGPGRSLSGIGVPWRPLITLCWRALAVAEHFALHASGFVRAAP